MCFLGSAQKEKVKTVAKAEKRAQRCFHGWRKREEDLSLGYEQRPKEMRKEEKGLSSMLLHTSSHLSNYQLQIAPSCFPKDLI